MIHQQGKASRTLSDRIDRWVLGSGRHPGVFADDVPAVPVQYQPGRSAGDFFDLAVQTVAVDGVRHALSSWAAPEWLITLLADGLGGGLQVGRPLCR
ncbi:MAG: hypothetical protein R3E95_16725 [Thiolinea sp.]